MDSFTVTSTFRMTKQVRQYEPVTFESTVTATYSSPEDIESIEEAQDFVSDLAIKQVEKQMEGA